MPKINSSGTPSYEGHRGVVTNAVGEQFEVNPSLDLAGEHADGYINEPAGQFDESPAPGTAGPIVPVDDEDHTPDGEDEDERQKQAEDDDRKNGDEWDPAAPQPGNQTPSFDTPKPAKNAPAKKAAVKK